MGSISKGKNPFDPKKETPFPSQEETVLKMALMKFARELDVPEEHLDIFVKMIMIEIKQTGGDVAAGMANIMEKKLIINGRSIRLTKIEFDIICTLALKIRRIVSYRVLIERVWGKKRIGPEGIHLLSVNINRLRRKIEQNPAEPKIILTSKGWGYKLILPLTGQD